MKESQIQKQILDYLNSLLYCWAIKVISANERGTPDILCSYNGMFYAFEVKVPTNGLSKIQEAQHKRIKKAGAKVYIVSSVEEVKATL